MIQEAYATNFKKLADLEGHVGKELGISKWIDITQEKINTFATLAIFALQRYSGAWLYGAVFCIAFYV